MTSIRLVAIVLSTVGILLCDNRRVTAIVLDPGFLTGFNTFQRRIPLAQTFVPLETGVVQEIIHGLDTRGGLSSFNVHVYGAFTDVNGSAVPIPPGTTFKRSPLLFQRLGSTDFSSGGTTVDGTVSVGLTEQFWVHAGGAYMLILEPASSGDMAWRGSGGGGAYPRGSAYEFITAGPVVDFPTANDFQIPTVGPLDHTFQINGTKSKLKFDLHVAEIGNASLLTTGNDLVVSNIGSSGLDGVAVDLGSALAYEASWEDIDAGGTTLPVGAFLENTVFGQIGGIPGRPILSKRREKTANGVFEINTQFHETPAAPISYGFTRLGVNVGTASNIPAGTPTIISIDPNNFDPNSGSSGGGPDNTHTFFPNSDDQSAQERFERCVIAAGEGLLLGTGLEPLLCTEDTWDPLSGVATVADIFPGFNLSGAVFDTVHYAPIPGVSSTPIDLLTMVQFLGKDIGSVSFTAMVAPVPEPSTIVLTVLGAVCLARRASINPFR